MKTTLAQKQAARRERVVRAAMELASEGGYDAVQMRDVAARAGVALGTLYRYFASKDQLLAAANREWVGDLAQNTTRRPPRGDSAADRVVDVLRRANKAIDRNPNLASAVIRALTSPDRARTEGPGESMRNILTMAMGEEGPSQRDEIIHVLDLVWFALIVQWMSGHRTADEMSDVLESAARLLIR
jgi:AcrR family transcriptional regulator